MKWQDLKIQVISMCDDEEYIRVYEEIELFEKRNWNNYVFFLIELLQSLDV